MTKNMTVDEEYEFYAHPTNQIPQGAAIRRRKRMGEPVPVRFPEDLLTRIKEEADADDRSVSSWIRRAVEHELERNAG
jgi:predicted HicB family RNase H-like nuclease